MNELNKIQVPVIFSSKGVISVCRVYYADKETKLFKRVLLNQVIILNEQYSSSAAFSPFVKESILQVSGTSPEEENFLIPSGVPGFFVYSACDDTNTNS